MAIMMKLYTKYMSLILDTRPSKTWQVARLLLHWVTLPIKLIAIGSLGLYQIINQRKQKIRPLPGHMTESLKKEYFNHILDRLPVFKNDSLDLYVNRVPYYEASYGWNHNFDHQAARHGTYVFLMNKLGKQSIKMDNALIKHVQQGQLTRGYGLNPMNKEWVFNRASVSGDMLVGFCLGMMSLRNRDKNNRVNIQGTDSALLTDQNAGFIKERFDELLCNILDNDYALLEGQRPEDDTEGNLQLWEEIEKHNEKAIVKRTMKSNRANWQPGLETVGAQALTLLAAVRIGDKILGGARYKREYTKLLFRYGYGLLSLFPTAFIKSKRGYFNDHNCMVSLYILSELSDSKLGKKFWGFAMKYVWALSKNYYNGYFTGLLNEAHPGSVSKEYIDACIQYLYEEKPIQHAYNDSARVEPEAYPVKFNEMNQDEFHPDMEQRLLLPPGMSDEDKRIVLSGLDRTKSGLGWLAHAVMLESDNGRRFLG